MAKIGVIVPLYNVEKYLCKCIESILRQTFQDFELILIDDGSTDTSGKICDFYAIKYKNIRVIHKIHEGVSAARNCGLDENENEYIVFVDADDFIEPLFLEILFSAAQEKGADIVFAGSGYFVENGKKKIKIYNYGVKEILENVAIITKKEAYRRVLLGKNTIALWEKIYHRKIFQFIRFPIGEIHEDGKVFNQIIENANVIAYVSSYAGYFYQIRSGSLTHNVMSQEEFRAIKNAEFLRYFIKRCYPDIEYAAKRYYGCCCLRLINKMLFDDKYKYDYYVLRKKILKVKRSILFSRHTTVLEKGKTVCLMIGVNFYLFALTFYYYCTKSVTV